MKSLLYDPKKSEINSATAWLIDSLLADGQEVLSISPGGGWYLQNFFIWALASLTSFPQIC